MADIELSSYVTSLSSATLTGTEEVYLVGDEKTTTQDIADLGNSNIKVWKAQVTQTGTSAPVLTVLENTLGVTVTTSYTGVGVYSLSGFASNLTGLVSMTAYCPTTGNVLFYVNTGSVAQLETVNSAASATNAILASATQLSNILTVTKYD